MIFRLSWTATIFWVPAGRGATSGSAAGAGELTCVSPVVLPAAFPNLFRTKWDWSFHTTPQLGLGGQSAFWPRMKALGGCSSMNANIYIRGIGQPDALQTFDPAVGVYIDDVYLPTLHGSMLNLIDLDRVEHHVRPLDHADGLQSDDVDLAGVAEHSTYASDPFGRLMWFALGDPAAVPSPYDENWVFNRISDVESKPRR